MLGSPCRLPGLGKGGSEDAADPAPKGARELSRTASGPSSGPRLLPSSPLYAALSHSPIGGTPEPLLPSLSSSPLPLNSPSNGLRRLKSGPMPLSPPIEMPNGVMSPSGGLDSSAGPMSPMAVIGPPGLTSLVRRGSGEGTRGMDKRSGSASPVGATAASLRGVRSLRDRHHTLMDAYLDEAVAHSPLALPALEAHDEGGGSSGRMRREEGKTSEPSRRSSWAPQPSADPTSTASFALYHSFEDNKPALRRTPLNSLPSANSRAPRRRGGAPSASFDSIDEDNTGDDTPNNGSANLGRRGSASGNMGRRGSGSGNFGRRGSASGNLARTDSGSGNFGRTSSGVMVPVDFTVAATDDQGLALASDPEAYERGLTTARTRLSDAQRSKPVVSFKTLDGSEANLKIFSQDVVWTMLAAEVAAIQQLQHPHVAQITSVLEGDDSFAMVQEPCPTNLVKYYETRHAKDDDLPFEREKILRWMLELAGAVAYLHDQHTPLMHRNIRPRNCLMTADGILKLGEFGESVYLFEELEAGTDRMGQKLYRLYGNRGHGRFSAPETRLVDGDHDAEGEDGYVCKKTTVYNQSADVFSVAMTFFFLASATFPYHGEGSANAQKMVAAGRRPATNSKCIQAMDGETTDVSQLLASCWHAKPYRRPKAKDVVERLQHVQHAIRLQKRSPSGSSPDTHRHLGI